MLALRDRARAVAADGVARFGRHNDSWINGYSKDFARVMADEGWIGMGWPIEHGGRARPPIERLIVAEEMISAGGHFVIDGQKIWSSFGHVADYCYLICRTSDEGPPHRGVSEIIVPMDTSGIEVRPITDMVANRHFCEIYFTEVRVPAANLVGAEGDAFKQTMVQLAHERGGIDRLVSNRALFLHARSQADCSDPRVRQKIARLETEYRVGRLLVYREVLGQAPTGFSAATKAYCTEHEQRVAQFAAASHGKVLFHLDRKEGSRLVDLAKLNAMRVQSMAELVDEMEAEGLVVREPDPADGRAKRIRYTDAGLAALDASTAADLAMWDDYAAIVGTDELEAVQRCLAELTDYHGGTPGDISQPDANPGGEAT